MLSQVQYRDNSAFMSSSDNDVQSSKLHMFWSICFKMLLKLVQQRIFPSSTNELLGNIKKIHYLLLVFSLCS